MSYVAKIFLVTLVILLVVAATNYAADPYGIYASGAQQEPLERELFRTNVRLAKAHVISRLRPQALILGSSRVEVAIPTEHPGWRYEPVYNAGLPNAGIREVLAYLKHAIAVGELKQVVLGLDFYQFNPVLLEPRDGFRQCRLREPRSYWSTVRAELCDIPALLLSRRAFEASIARFFRGTVSAAYLRDGTRNPEAREFVLNRMGNQRAAFINSESHYLRDLDLLKGLQDAQDQVATVTEPYFEEILRLSHRHGVDLRLFISPSHARHWEIIDELGLWDDFVHWKRYLLDATNSIAAEYSAQPYSLWDFADYNRYTQESVPSPDDADSRMNWYWESSHFTRELGDIVLSQILEGERNGLGRRLDAESFDKWIRSIEIRKATYRNRNSADLAAMQNLSRSRP